MTDSWDAHPWHLNQCATLYTAVCFFMMCSEDVLRQSVVSAVSTIVPLREYNRFFPCINNCVFISYEKGPKTTMSTSEERHIDKDI